MKSTKNHYVTIIIPCRNEKNYIDGVIQSALNQFSNGVIGEVIISDGMSNDGTREIIKDYCHKNSVVRLLDNPQKIVSSGMNIAIKEAIGEVIVRFDTHSLYAKNYVFECLRSLRETSATNVGGAARTKSSCYLQAANCLVYQSKLSVGGARFHNPDYEGWVDTVTYGCWYKAELLKVGLFDECLARNQDDEHNFRILLSGGRIWQSRNIVSWYFPRSSIISIFRQYFQYGFWKVRILQKHRKPSSLRQFVPAFFVLVIFSFLILSLFSIDWLSPLLLILIVYFMVLLSGSILACKSVLDIKYIPVMPLIFTSYHIGYGIGYLFGIYNFYIRRNLSTNLFSTITR